MIEIFWDKNFVTPHQEKIALKAAKSIQKYLKLPTLPNYEVLGFNPSKMIEELNKDADKKSKQELKAARVSIKNLEKNKEFLVKSVFDLNIDPIDKLVFNSNIISTTGTGVLVYLWNALLNFPISEPIIFGRVHKKVAHGGGIYCFAPIELNIPRTLETVEEHIKNNTINKYLSEFIEDDDNISAMRDLRRTEKARESMKLMFQLMKSKQPSSVPIVDTLNQNKQLVKIMMSVMHFGAASTRNSLLVSQIDVSTICIPLKVATALQLLNMMDTHARSFRAIYELSNTLKSLGK